MTLPEPLAADLVLYNGTFLTMADDRPRAGALAIRDGKILAVGSEAEVRELAGRRTETIDLGGRTALPGLADCHLHLASDAAQYHLVDVRNWFTDVASIGDILERLRERAKRTPLGEWVIARGTPLQEFRLRERRRLNRWDLDRALPDHPCYLTFGAHITMVNSKALEAKGITRDTPDPPGGVIERDPATGEPTGVLKERAQYLVKQRQPEISQRELEENIVGELRDCLKRGVTLIHDIVVSGQEINAYLRLANGGRLPIRVHLLVRVIESRIDRESLLDLGFVDGFGGDFLKLGGVKISIDGGTTGRNLALSEPLLGEPENRGIIRIEQDELDETIWRYHEMGMRICTHAVGDVAHRMALSAYEKALARLPRKDHRHRVEHLGNWLFTPETLAWAKRLEVIPMPNPSSLRHVGDIYKPLMGPERMRWAYRFGTVLREGWKTTFTSDGPGSYPCNPLREVSTLVTRQTLGGEVINPEEAITVAEALRAQTANAAWVSFEERRLGTLEPGKLADVTVLGADPLTYPPEQLDTMPVDLVIVGGKVAYSG